MRPAGKGAVGVLSGERQHLPMWVPQSRLVKGPPPKVRPDFRRTFLDFQRGIRMGNIEPNQRITQILKAYLEDRHGTRFITDRWGRGVYWRWICWLPVESRRAKPLSSKVNFGCAKFYVAINLEGQTFEAGLQIERAPMVPGVSWVHTQTDWDVHTLVRGLKGRTKIAREIARLVRQEEFTVRSGPFMEQVTYTSATYRGPAPLARAMREMAVDQWGGFQLCCEFSRDEVQAMTGSEIVAAVGDIFDELVSLGNQVMTVPCLRATREK
jgi:hypothetical protein